LLGLLGIASKLFCEFPSQKAHFKAHSNRLKNIKERSCGSFQNPPDLLPSLMVDICLVLASVVDFFLDSRKQGLPCWLG